MAEPLLFSTEAHAREALLAAAADPFILASEVPADVPGLLGRGAIDVVGIAGDYGYVVGFEVKRGYAHVAEYVAALKQAIDYRCATLSQGAPQDFAGKVVAAIFVFPTWDAGGVELKRERYRERAHGAEILAAKFRVGAARIDPMSGLSLNMGENRLWDAQNGWVKNAENILYGKLQFASQRRPQPGQIARIEYE